MSVGGELIDASARFPRAQVMLQMIAVAEVLRQAADELEPLCGAAHAYEPSTLPARSWSRVLAYTEGST